jgi:YD repeat-containing protein
MLDCSAGGILVVRRSWYELAAIVAAIGVVAVTANATETITYTYDAHGRLVKVVHTGDINNNVMANYTYDDADNRTNVTVTIPPIMGTESADNPLNGTAANDTVYGLGGNDWIYLHQGGADTVYGGDGNELFLFGSDFSSLDVVDGGNGSDQIALQGIYPSLVLSATSLTSIESIVFLKYTDTRFTGATSTPNSYNVTTVDANVPASGLIVLDASQLLSSETLTLDGSAETDGRFTVAGGDGNDTITTGAGNDTLIGRPGADRLTGGAGSDTYKYTALHSSAAAWDTIVGFNDSGDRIDLPVTISGFATAVTGASLSSSNFASNLATAVSGVLGAGQAVKVTASSGDMAGRVFLVADADGTAGFNSATDYVFELESIASLTGSTNIFI